MERPCVGECIEPGKVWLDVAGAPIQAHGGGILYDCGTYYWFGENKDGETKFVANEVHRVDVVGISCYSSRDLLHWKHEGVVLPANTTDPGHDLHVSKVVERPKVIYNAVTRQYVMWLHVDTYKYELAQAGVAVSDAPTGPYRYLGSSRPNGAESRDMTVFQDDDGSAYLIYSSERHSTLHISRLTPDYLGQSGQFIRAFVTRPLNGREAPAVFKHDGCYFMVSSGCTGWDPNPAEYAMARSMLGDWQVLGDPCCGPDHETTFHAQSTFVLPMPGRPGCFIFMADRWQKENLRDSRYVWLPLRMNGLHVTITWRDRWDLAGFANPA